MYFRQLSTLILLIFAQNKPCLLQVLAEAEPVSDTDSESDAWRPTDSAPVPVKTGDFLDYAAGDIQSCQPGAPVNTSLLQSGYKYLNITWQPAEASTIDCGTNRTLGYAVFFYKRRSGAANVEIFNTEADVTFALLKGLEPGTFYCYSVQANYSTGLLSGEKQCDRTQGYGPDNACNCSPQGTDLKFRTSCEPKTGQCKCKTKMYTGRQCEKCVGQAYHNPKTGCHPCPCKVPRSSGKCFVTVQGIVMCDCYGIYGGRSCESCRNGYYINQGICVACNCSGNADLSSEHICDAKTGKCLACAYNTTGDHCERCLPNHEGHPSNHSCIVKDERPHHPADPSQPIHLGAGSIIGITLATICAAVIALTLVFYQHCKSCRRKPLNFWTVELKDDHENVSFSGMMEQPEFQNVDAALLEGSESRRIYLDSNPPRRLEVSRSPPAERPSTLSLSPPYRALRT